ncbi:hypothetical protein GCM10010260_45300 [Streptomyces filipinensis]|uniref:Uncharacterized protein n=1 Tax=Streptomyces filipinensis TaxID=66887 RepID=A0A918IEN2_9ACTN|nr:hypothetical protein GCM10010260_45300 [Streptomyces filipinensis]
MVVELPGLSGEEQVLDGLADQRGALDPLDESVAEVVVEIRGTEGSGSVGTHHVHAVVQRPPHDRVGGRQVVQPGVESGVRDRAHPPFGLLPVAGYDVGDRLAEVVDAVEGDHRGQPAFEGRRPGGEQSAHAVAEQRDPVPVDLRQGQREVEDGAHDVLPVRPEDQPVAVQRSRLPRAFEDEDGVAALRTRHRSEEVHLLGRAVEAVVHDHGRPGGGGGAGPVRTAGQGAALVGDADRFDPRGEQCCRGVEALHAALVGGPSGNRSTARASAAGAMAAAPRP